MSKKKKFIPVWGTHFAPDNCWYFFFFFAFDLIIFKRQTPQVYVAETIAHTMKMQAQFH